MLRSQHPSKMPASPLHDATLQRSTQSSALTLTADARLRQLLPELFNPTPPSGEQFLRITLSPDLTVAIALAYIEESLQLAAHLITPIPNMAPSVLGLMSTKGQVFWAVDLIKLMNLPLTLKPSQSYEVVVIRVNQGSDSIDDEAFSTASARAPSEHSAKFLGLLVPSIRGTIRLTSAQITTPSHGFDPNLQPYLSGQAMTQAEPLLVLDAEAIGSAEALELSAP